MFQSCLSVSHSVHGVDGSHVTINHDALDLTIQGPPGTLGMGPHCTGTPCQ